MQRISLERMAVKRENQTTQAGQATLEMHPSPEKRTQQPSMSAYDEEERENLPVVMDNSEVEW